VNLELRGRTAIVCGASSGMGLATAEALAEEGANVAMFGRRRDLLEREAERIGALAVRRAAPRSASTTTRSRAPSSYSCSRLCGSRTSACPTSSKAARAGS
jgi:NAD(P)-dependent dehydrogenase (short-subunit alcohol dehydrogenase family)